MKPITNQMMENSTLSGEDKVSALKDRFGENLAAAFVDGIEIISPEKLANVIQEVHELGKLGDKYSLPSKRQVLEQIGLTREAILFLFDGGYCGKEDNSFPSSLEWWHDEFKKLKKDCELSKIDWNKLKTIGSFQIFKQPIKEWVSQEVFCEAQKSIKRFWTKLSNARLWWYKRNDKKVKVTCELFLKDVGIEVWILRLHENVEWRIAEFEDIKFKYKEAKIDWEQLDTINSYINYDQPIKEGVEKEIYREAIKVIKNFWTRMRDGTKWGRSNVSKSILDSCNEFLDKVEIIAIKVRPLPETSKWWWNKLEKLKNDCKDANINREELKTISSYVNFYNVSTLLSNSNRSKTKKTSASAGFLSTAL